MHDELEHLRQVCEAAGLTYAEHFGTASKAWCADRRIRGLSGTAAVVILQEHVDYVHELRAKVCGAVEYQLVVMERPWPSTRAQDTSGAQSHHVYRPPVSPRVQAEIETITDVLTYALVDYGKANLDEHVFKNGFMMGLIVDAAIRVKRAD